MALPSSRVRGPSVFVGVVHDLKFYRLSSSKSATVFKYRFNAFNLSGLNLFHPGTL